MVSLFGSCGVKGGIVSNSFTNWKSRQGQYRVYKRSRVQGSSYTFNVLWDMRPLISVPLELADIVPVKYWIKAAIWGLAELANLLPSIGSVCAFVHCGSLYIPCNMAVLSKMTVHTSKTKAAVTPQWSPTMYKSGEMYEAVQISNAYLGRVELWNKFVEKLKLLCAVSMSTVLIASPSRICIADTSKDK